MSWKDLNAFISLECSSVDNNVVFKTRFDALARQSMTSLVESISDQIETEAEKLLESLPKPDAPFSAWNIESENELFPADIMERCAMLDELQVPPRAKDRPSSHYNRRETWERLATCQPRNAIVIVLHALNAPNPFEHLPSLIYLIQRARVPFHVLLKIHTRMRYVPVGDLDPGRTYFTDGPYGSALKNYISLTVAQYLYINVLEALENGPSCLANGSARQMTTFPYGNDVCGIATGLGEQSERDRIRPDAVESPANDWFLARRDSVHGDFWEAPTDRERKERDSTTRAVYKERCLSVIIAWYTMMKAMSDRNCAVGFPRVLFDKSGLERLITDAFTSIWPSFFYPSPPLNQRQGLADRMTSLMNAEVETSVDLLADSDGSILRLVQPHSTFYNLPSELHLHIHSFLSTPQLLSLSKVSVLMRRLSLPSLYMDPLQYIASSSIWPEEEGASDHTILQRMVKLQALLLSRGDLRQYIRSFRVRAGPARNEKFTRSKSYAIPMPSPLSNGLTNLSCITLTLDFPVSTAFMYHTFHALRLAARLYNQLESLNILLFPARSNILPIPPPLADNTELPRWRLRELSISIGRSRDAWTECGGGFPITELLHFLPGDDLDSLSLHYRDHIGPFQTFPIFSAVRTLNISSDSPYAETESLLYRSFPSLEYLSLTCASVYPTGARTVVNLASSSPHLRSLIFSTDYRIVGLPTTTTKVSMDWEDALNLHNVYEPVSLFEHVLAFKISFTTIYLGQVEVDESMNDLSIIPIIFPRIRSLELHDNVPGVRQREMGGHRFFLAMISNVFPNLEILVTSLREFNNRPRRVDFPVDDEIDERERDYAVGIFKQFPCLKMASLTGLSTAEDWDQPNVSRRVWARSNEDGCDVRAVGEPDFPDYVFL